MSGIQKANALPTWWIGKSPKYGIKIRVQMRAGFTDEEIQKSMQKKLERVDKAEDERRAREAYFQSDDYPRSKILKYKHQELQTLQAEIQRLSNQNNQRFAGGYTGPAIIDGKIESDRIAVYEAKCKAEIEKKYDGSRECLERIRPIARKDDEEYERLMERNKLMGANFGGGLSPRVGGRAGAHAAVHGGGFNHRGVYAGGVWR
jgi:hypothetical protein